METLEYYKLIRNSIQFYKVELLSLNCIKREVSSNKDRDKGQEVQIHLQRDINVISEDKAEMFLYARIGIPDGPFEFDIIYKGLCFKTLELSKTQFEQYAYDQIVPLMLPYVRECIASTMARMGLPIFSLPTMDVLDSIEANLKPEEDDQE